MRTIINYYGQPLRLIWHWSFCNCVFDKFIKIKRIIIVDLCALKINLLPFWKFHIQSYHWRNKPICLYWKYCSSHMMLLIDRYVLHECHYIGGSSISRKCSSVSTTGCGQTGHRRSSIGFPRQQPVSMARGNTPERSLNMQLRELGCNILT